jgi:hypothetical protein
MSLRRISSLASLTIFSATLSVSAQQPTASARLVRADGAVTLNGQAVAAGAATIVLGEVAEIQTKDSRAVIVLKRGGTFVLGPNSSARIHANGVYNFNRIEMLTGSAALLSASSSGLVACGTEARLSSEGVYRFDILDPERIDGTQRCRVRVHEGAASTPGASMSYVLRSGQEMVMNQRAGDLIPVSRLAPDAFDDLDRWAREQATVTR